MLVGGVTIGTRDSTSTVVSEATRKRVALAELTSFMFGVENAAIQPRPLPTQMGLPALNAFPQKLLGPI